MKNKDIEINYTQELGTNYMVLSAGLEENDYARRMISENVIEGIIPMHTSFVDGEAEYYYKINGLISLGQYFQRRTIEYDDLRKIVKAIAEMPKRLDAFLLDKNNIFLGVDSTFLSSDGRDVYFCFYPGAELDFNDGIRDIATFFLKKINHQDERCATAGYKLFEVACRDAFTLDELLSAVELGLKDDEKLFEVENEEMDDDAIEEYSASEESQKTLADELFDDLRDSFDFSNIKPNMKANASTNIDADMYATKNIDKDIFDGDFFEENFETENIPTHRGKTSKKTLKKSTLPRYEEKPSINDKLLKALPLIIPIIAFIIVAVFLFSSSMSDLSLALRIGCLFFVAIALTFIALIFKNKLDTDRE